VPKTKQNKPKVKPGRIEILEETYLSFRYSLSHKWDDIISKPQTEVLQRDW
jgi:hypothetical protein